MAPQLRGLRGFIFGRRYLGELREPLNAVIEHLSNSRSAKVIGLLNTYPFIITRRNFAGVIVTTQRLITTLTDNNTTPNDNHSYNEDNQA